MRAALFLLPLSACLFPLNQERGSADFDEPVDRVYVEVTNGDVRVVGTDAESAHLDFVKRFTSDPPDVAAEVHDGLLTVTMYCPPVNVGSCAVDLDLAVPAGVPVDVYDGVGDVELVDLAGPVTVTGSTSDVRLDGVSGEMDVEVGTGDVHGTDLAGPLTATVSTGDLDLSFDAPVDVTIDGSTSDVRLAVPAGRYDLDLQTGTGDEKASGISEDWEADALLRVHTVTGDIQVEGR